MLEIDKEKEFNLKKIYGSTLYNKWIKKYPILTNEDVLAWLRDKIDKFSNSGKDKSKFAITTYANQLQSYCLFNQVDNPTELLKEEIDVRNLRLKKYLNFLLLAKSEEELSKIKEIGFNKKPSEVSIRNMIQSRLKSFYSNRGANISFGIETAKSGKNENEINLTGDNGKDIIKKIKIKLESPEFKLVVQLQTQLGLRIDDVLNELPSGKYKIEKYGEHYFIKNFRTQKIGVVINYLFFTRELSELFQSIYNLDDLTKLDLTTILKTNRDTRIDQNSFLQRIKEVFDELGINGNIKTHSFRKYFSSQVRKCKKLDAEFKEHLMGHAEFNLSQSYNNNLRDIEWFYNNWKKIEILVCVDCIVYDTTNKDIIKLKEENLKLKEQVDLALKGKIELEKEMDSLKKMVSDLAKKLE